MAASQIESFKNKTLRKTIRIIYIVYHMIMHNNKIEYKFKTTFVFAILKFDIGDQPINRIEKRQLSI